MSHKLEAVNRLLHALGKRGLGSLEGRLDEDHLRAIRAVDQTTREVQAEGWDFNTDRNKTLTPDGDGHIDMPTNWYSYSISPRYGLDPRDYTVRANKLFNTKTQSDVFTAGVEFSKIIYQFPFDDLPPLAREYIAIRAQREFLYNLQRDSALSAPLQQEIEFRGRLMREFLNSNRPSMFRDPDVRETSGSYY